MEIYLYNKYNYLFYIIRIYTYKQINTLGQRKRFCLSTFIVHICIFSEVPISDNIILKSTSQVASTSLPDFPIGLVKVSLALFLIQAYRECVRTPPSGSVCIPQNSVYSFKKHTLNVSIRRKKDN